METAKCTEERENGGRHGSVVFIEEWAVRTYDRQSAVPRCFWQLALEPILTAVGADPRSFPALPEKGAILIWRSPIVFTDTKTQLRRPG